MSSKCLNRPVSAWISTSLMKPLIAGTQQIFIFFCPKSKNAVFKYRLVASFDISVFGILAEWDRRLLGYERLAVRLVTGRIAARNLLQRCAFAATWPSRRCGPFFLSKAKQKCKFAKGQAITVAPKSFIHSQHIWTTCAMTWHVDSARVLPLLTLTIWILLRRRQREKVVWIQIS